MDAQAPSPQPSWPASMLVNDLLETGVPRAERVPIERATDLYEGGQRFAANRHQYLVQHDLERHAPPGMENVAAQQWASRLRRAWYFPMLAGIVDWLAARIVDQGPRVVATGGTEEAREYYEGLNEDSDGAGLDFQALCLQLLCHEMVANRAWVLAAFPEQVPGQAPDLAATLHAPAPLEIEGWQYDVKGELAWVRRHRVDYERSTPYSRQVEERHRWVFLTPTEIVTYEAAWSVGQPPSPGATAKRSVVPHDLGQVPAWQVRTSHHVWLGERLFEPCIAFYNVDADISYGLHRHFLALLKMNLLENRKPNDVVASESVALALQVGESADFISPRPDFEAAFKQRMHYRDQLYAVVHSAALALASQPQNARQSAAAKEMDRDPLWVFLRSFAWAVEDALQAALNAIADYRGDKVEPKVVDLLPSAGVTTRGLQEHVEGIAGAPPRPAAEPDTEEEEDEAEEEEK